MKIKITEDCLVDGEHTPAGTIVDVPLPQATTLLISGRAEPDAPEEGRAAGAMVAQTATVEDNQLHDDSSKIPRTDAELDAAVLPRGLQPIPQEELQRIPGAKKQPVAAKHETAHHHAKDDDDENHKSGKK